MATQRSSFEKRERDRAKKAKAAAKREKRLEKGTDEAEGEEGAAAPSTDASSSEEILEQVAVLHQQFDDGEIEFEEFEERKADLMSRLAID